MWEQIQANRRRSAILLIGMAGVLFLLGYVGGELLFPGAGILGVGLALIIWGIQMALYASNPQSLLLQGAFARELSKEDSPQLFNVVEEMCLASGLGYIPSIHLVDDPAPNAFALGRNPGNSAVVVTTGLLHRLNRDELQGVIAHEIGHLKNRDVQFMTLAAVFLGSIVILSEIIWRSVRLGGRSRDRRGGGQAQMIILVIAILLVVLGPLLAQILYFICSRKREYLADASSAQFTRYPEGLASALEKISATPSMVSFASKATAPMFIINPLAATGGSTVFSTHPPTAERIRILRGMSGASFAAYETAYRQGHSGSLIGEQSLSDSQTVPVRNASDAGPIQTRVDAQYISNRAHGYLRLRCNCGLEISVPEGYEQNSIRCIRCGSTLPVPTVVTPPSTPVALIPPVIPVAADAPILQYTRTGSGWESFRCTCGRTIQLSPQFEAPHIRCKACQRLIQVA